MRFFFISLLFCLSSIHICAQQISDKEFAKHQKKIKQSKENNSVLVSLDTIFNAGVPYALMHKVYASDHDFSIKNLTGNELIYCRFNSYDISEHTSNIGSVEKRYYYQFLCKTNHKQFETEEKSMQDIALFIVENKMIHMNAIDEEVFDVMIEKYGNKYSAVRNKPVEVFIGDTSENNYQIIARDINTFFNIIENKIIQDNTYIGIIEQEKIQEGVISVTTYSIKLPNTQLVAKAKIQSYGNNEIEISTNKDNKVIRITKPTYDIEKMIIQYLIDNAYL